ncbi:MAG: hypothetical protein GXO22_07175 [Aquificae bacterium]|nr:hypothetical protein [Aquificota bacterium]
MKKILLTLLLVSSITFAADKKEYNLAEVMKTLEEATIKILKGFLWDNDQWIIEGAHIIANHPEPEGGMLKYVRPERRTQAFGKYLERLDKLVRETAQDIETLTKHKKKGLAADRFNDMLKACNSCHAVFRGW